MVSLPSNKLFWYAVIAHRFLRHFFKHKQRIITKINIKGEKNEQAQKFSSRLSGLKKYKKRDKRDYQWLSILPLELTILKF